MASTPNITGELLSGRTLDQRREFVAAVTEAAIAILNAKGESGRIVSPKYKPPR